MQYGQKRKCPCGCGLDANSQAYTDPREIIDIEGIIHVISRQFKVEKRPTCIAKINEMKAEAEIKLAVRRGQLEGMVKSESGKNDLAALSRTATPAASVSWMAHDEIGMASLTPEQREDVPIIFRSKSGTTRQLDNILLPLSTEVSFNTLELLVRRLHEESRMRNVSKHAATGAVTYLIDLMKIHIHRSSILLSFHRSPCYGTNSLSLLLQTKRISWTRF
ncbi:hypothetical protein BCR33DRAFT_230368 [Rhizoclosmatium globosum]|uniref:Uncharacterized protein n=1 Tax=Rhizoclosmatium globosum TaxID=329046 RepID=A0A1Y2AEM4_9FUNG|nr:hypothetical protein BCR33DRAFT_230368 [Rhizoclosmatium globosum]|eukprot:ORY20717.1 hypothetical protein BCR33DRAFT_230368 [Rhizoclosmatium globosum]